MKGEHMWGNPDFAGARACVKDGCTIRVADSFRYWQRKKGGHWRVQSRELIPECAGTLKTLALLEGRQ